MGFGSSANLPSPTPSAGNIPPTNLATNQQSSPVPYLAGRRRIGLTWIDDMRDVTSQGIYTDAGKDGDVQTGTAHWATLAGAICCGPLTQVDEIWINNSQVWVGPMLFNGADVLSITLPGWGYKGDCVALFYPGTNTQTCADASDWAARMWALLSDALYWRGAVRRWPGWFPAKSNLGDYIAAMQSLMRLPAVENAYRGIAWAKFPKLNLGLGQTNAPNIEVVVTRLPAWDWLNPGSNGNGANPVSILVDWLTDARFGLGIGPDKLDQTALVEAAAVLKASGLELSPLLTSPTELKSLVATLCEHAEMFPIVTSSGKVSVVLDKGSASPGSLPQLTSAALMERPQWDVPDWSQVPSIVAAQFTDASLAYQSNISRWRDRANMDISGENNLATITRDWMIIENMAQTSAMAYARKNGSPLLSGSLAVRRTGTWFEDLAPGNLFRLYLPDDGLGDTICRVLERTDPGPAMMSFDISFQCDRSYLGSWSGGSPRSKKELRGGIYPQLSPVLPDLEQVRLVELPLALCLDGKPALTVLARKDTASALGAAVWLDRNFDGSAAPPDSYELLGTATLCQAGTLAEDYPAGRSGDVTGGPVVQLEGPDTTLDEGFVFDALADSMLLFMGDEIMSVAGMETLGAGLYQLHGFRGRFSTPIGNHSNGDAAFLIRRDQLGVFSHAHFQVGTTVKCKVAPASGKQVLALDGVTPISLMLTGRAYTDLAPFNLTVNGFMRNATYTAVSGLVVGCDAPSDLAKLPPEVTVVGVLELVKDDDTVMHSQTVPTFVESLTLAWTDVSGWVGATVDFRVRMTFLFASPWFMVNSGSAELAVKKV